jgi:hypothetical protein
VLVDPTLLFLLLTQGRQAQKLINKVDVIGQLGPSTISLLEAREWQWETRLLVTIIE